jgi:hypothetical protein
MYAHKEDKETNIFIGQCSEKFELKTENSDYFVPKPREIVPRCTSRILAVLLQIKLTLLCF